VEFWEHPVLYVVTCNEHFTFLLLCLLLGDGSSRAGTTKKSHFSKQKEAQKIKTVENLQESVKGKRSCEC
jgi:hypothetical protein